MAILACVAAAQAAGPALPGWQLDVTASSPTSLDLRGEAFADDFATFGFAHEFQQVQILTPGVFAVNPLIGGTSYGAARLAHAADGGVGHFAWGTARPSLLIYGLETDTITIEWTNSSSTAARTDGWIASAQTNTPFTLQFYVENAPLTAAVQYFTQYELASRIYTAHEGAAEDPAYVRQANLYIDGQNLTADRFDLDGIAGDLGASRDYSSPVLVQSTTVGTRKEITVTGETLAAIATPGVAAGPYEEDGSFAVFRGRIRIRFDLGGGSPPAELLDPEALPGLITYSLDIGSDSELSDPGIDGSEAWDPGDVYVFGARNQPPGMDGPWNDELLNTTSFDFFPEPPAGSTPPAPVCTGPPPGGIISAIFMDLDGHHLVDVDLRPLIPSGAPLAASVPRFTSDAIFDARYLVVSFDDDGPDSHTDCDLPVHATSSSGRTYGGILRQDEAVALELDLFSVPTVVLAESGLWHEGHFSFDLLPLPPAPISPERWDDDVDSLCAVEIDPNSCPWLLFTVDHEAPGSLDPMAAFPMYWDPGVILLAQTTPGCATLLPVELVHPTIHLGLPPGTDVDAFAFAFVWDAAEGRDGLALLFSVDEDDLATPDDESGGLDPRMIYVSFLTGNSRAFLDRPLQDDVDALALTRQRVSGSFRPPSFCDAADGAHAHCPCGASDPEAGCDIAHGSGVRLDVLAQLFQPSSATVRGAGYPPAATPTAIVIRGNNLEPVPVPFGDGLRCVGVTGFARLAATNAAGGVSTHVFSHSAQPGSYFYQLWFRNLPASYCVTFGPAAGAFNLSNGRILTW